MPMRDAERVVGVPHAITGWVQAVYRVGHHPQARHDVAACKIKLAGPERLI
jgi:hypothetical protein